MTADELKQQLGKKKYKELGIQLFDEKIIRLEAEIKQKETELKRLNKELHNCRECILLFEDINAYITGA